MTEAKSQPNVTARESQVIDKILAGLSNKKIAEELFISERTVKFHCSNIFRKFEATNRTSLVVKIHQKSRLESLKAFG